MIAIIGLGNPGKKYSDTRHNLGFSVLNEFHNKLSDFPPFTAQQKFQAAIAQGIIKNKKIILAKPQTFINLSGQSTLAIKNFYKISTDNIWVIHDDLDLPLGHIRLSQNSGAGGHNGVESIIKSLNSKNFIRFRLGIGRPPNGDPAEYVLQKPLPNEKKLLEVAQKKTINALEAALSHSITKAQTEFN